ncbi:MAG TPA: hypothetical protein LFW10_00460, partial [Rickettsia endosymbiont of Diachasma alloeum]|nr:hypothetical protein [Rickettsia endosymbiont of Diachasma alloeum]
NWLFSRITSYNVCYTKLLRGKYCYGKTPMQTFKDSKKLAVDKNNEILYLEYSSDSYNLSDIQI